MDIEKERELFEKFYLKEFGDDYTCPYAQLDKRNGEYIDFHTQDTWITWLASRNREGYVLVPADALNRTVGHIAIALCHPNNSKNEEDVMHKDLEIIEKAMIGTCDD